MHGHFDPYKEDAEKRGVERAKEAEIWLNRRKNWALEPGHARKSALTHTNMPSAKARAKVSLAPINFGKNFDGDKP